MQHRHPTPTPASILPNPEHQISGFPIVDEERGLVYAIIRFDHNGRNKTITWNDGSVHSVNMPFDEPFSFLVGELFKIKNGKIYQIEALVLNVPYGMHLGWEE